MDDSDFLITLHNLERIIFNFKLDKNNVLTMFGYLLSSIFKDKTKEELDRFEAEIRWKMTPITCSSKIYSKSQSLAAVIAVVSSNTIFKDFLNTFQIYSSYLHGDMFEKARDEYILFLKEK